MSRVCNSICYYAQDKSDLFKVYIALISASIVPATLYSLSPNSMLYSGASGFGILLFTWFAAFVVSFAHAALLGLPVYMQANKRGMVTWWFSALAGFVVGILPVTLFAMLDISSAKELGSYLEFVWKPGVLGMSGGLAAWLVLGCLNKQRDEYSL